PMRSVSGTLRCPRPLLLAMLVCLLCDASLIHAQQNSSAARDEWFYSQRRYGLGYIPDDALAKAVAQRDGLRIGRTATDTAQDDPPAVTSGHWVSFGPLGINSTQSDLVSGRVNSLAIDPTNPSTVYIAAAGGGVWKSTNRGGRWTPMTDALPSLASGAV